MNNEFTIEFISNSENERLARTLCSVFLLPLDPTLDELSEIKTAVSEAVTNAVIHGYKGGQGIIKFKGILCGDTVTYIISDFGQGIADIDKAREPLYSGSSDEERSGMGFSIMETFTDEMVVESGVGEGTTVILKKRFGCDGR